MADIETTTKISTDIETKLNELSKELDQLTTDFYIAVGVLSCVLALVGILSVVLYYWVYVLEKSMKKAASTEEADYKIKRVALKDSRPPSHNDYSGRSPSPSLAPNVDQRNFRNPLTNNSYQPQQPTPFKQHLQQQLQQNNPQQRYSNTNGFNDMRRNTRQTEQQLHQNFYGVDNGNFQY